MSADLRAGQRFAAPAKVNRCLHVLGRAADGYHRLQTVFQFLDWGDELEIEPVAGESIELLGDLSGVPASHNLAWRAADLLRRAAGRKAGARITLHKRIPPGSGLGGGSSDAATVLCVLNRLWGLHWPLARLQALGLELGADVPVFVRGQACVAEGRGEQMQAVEPPETAVCLALPEVHCSTAQVFAHPKVQRNTPRFAPPDWPHAVAEARNDCLAAALDLYPELAALEQRLQASHNNFTMSGTGSAFFCTMQNRKEARTIAGFVEAAGAKAVVTNLSNVSALHQSLETIV
jgi:4-diphosphocytidyl-2-C-methyl-D-erythritol kinase